MNEPPSKSIHRLRLQTNTKTTAKKGQTWATGVLPAPTVHPRDKTRLFKRREIEIEAETEAEKKPPTGEHPSTVKNPRPSQTHKTQTPRLAPNQKNASSKKPKKTARRKKRAAKRKKEKKARRKHEARTVLCGIGVVLVLPGDDDAALCFCVDGEVHVWELGGWRC
jgi:hypothetical protein